MQNGLVLALTVVIVTSAAPRARQTAAEVDDRIRSVRALLEEGRYDEAEAQALAVAALTATSSDARTAARARELEIDARVRNGRVADPRTRELAEALVRARETRGDPPGAIAASLSRLGEVLLEAGEYRRAAACLERALAASSGAGTEPLEVANTLDLLARAELGLERLDRALAAADKALSIKEGLPHDRDLAIARTLAGRGLIWQRKGDLPRARSDLERALAAQELIQPAHPRTADVLRLLGLQLWLEGDLSAARDTLDRALRLKQAALRPGHPDIATSLRALAVPVNDLSDLAGAKDMRERALAIAEESLGAGHPVVADYLNDLALSLNQQGEYSRARQLQERALALYERHLGPDHSNVATAVYNLAFLNHSIGDGLEARRLHQRAVKTWERAVGPDHPFVSWALDGFAEALADQGNHQEAVPLYERALAIRERTLGVDNPRVARTLAHLASSLADLGRRRRAYELSGRAIRIWEGAGSPEGLSEALLVRARILRDRGDYPGASDAYQRAHDLRLPLFGRAHPSLANAQTALAEMQAALGHRAAALTASLEAEGTSRDHLRLTVGYLPERQALGYAAQAPASLDLALSLVMENDDASAVLDALIRRRALVLDEMASRQRSRRTDAEGELAPLWKALTDARQRLANLAVRVPSESRLPQYADLLEGARREKEQAERRLAERSAAFRSLVTRAETGLDEVRAALPDRTALISIVRYDRSRFPPPAGAPAPQGAAAGSRTVPSYLAFVLRAGSARPDVVPLGAARGIDALVARWRQAIGTGVTEPARATPAARSLAAAGAALRRRIWDPIAVHLAGSRHVFVVPDGALNLVTLAGLPADESRYLIETGPVIHHLSAERDLSADAWSSDAGEGLLAVGDPAYGDPAASGRGPSMSDAAGSREKPAVRPALAATNSGVVDARSGARRSACGSFRTMRFEPLPASRREAEDVAALWRTLGSNAMAARSAEVLAGADAHEAAVKRSGPGRRVLHLATHGFFLGDDCAPAAGGTRAVGRLVGPQPARSAPARLENPLLRSGLALAGAARRAAAQPHEEDGILTAEEVAALHLDGVEWAVLSACDTGLGEVLAGEGVFGLRRAFQIAGARTVIMSLWSVEDRATLAWMRALYEGRIGRRLSTADAVREASVAVLRDRRARGLSTHPFFWAGFVAAGDWR